MSFTFILFLIHMIHVSKLLINTKHEYKRIFKWTMCLQEFRLYDVNFIDGSFKNHAKLGTSVWMRLIANDCCCCCYVLFQWTAARIHIHELYSGLGSADIFHLLTFRTFKTDKNQFLRILPTFRQLLSFESYTSRTRTIRQSKSHDITTYIYPEYRVGTNIVTWAVHVNNYTFKMENIHNTSNAKYIKHHYIKKILFPSKRNIQDQTIHRFIIDISMRYFQKKTSFYHGREKFVE